MVCTIVRQFVRVAYPRNGNTHSPKIEYAYDNGLGWFPTLAKARRIATEETGATEFLIVNSQTVDEIHAIYPHGKYPRTKGDAE